MKTTFIILLALLVLAGMYLTYRGTVETESVKHERDSLVTVTKLQEIQKKEIRDSVRILEGYVKNLIVRTQELEDANQKKETELRKLRGRKVEVRQLTVSEFESNIKKRYK